jgi:hypothetical protein
MRDSDKAGPGRVLELLVATLLPDLAPAIGLKPGNDFAAVHRAQVCIIHTDARQAFGNWAPSEHCAGDLLQSLPRATAGYTDHSPLKEPRPTLTLRAGRSLSSLMNIVTIWPSNSITPRV